MTLSELWKDWKTIIAWLGIERGVVWTDVPERSGRKMHWRKESRPETDEEWECRWYKLWREYCDQKNMSNQTVKQWKHELLDGLGIKKGGSLDSRIKLLREKYPDYYQLPEAKT